MKILLMTIVAMLLVLGGIIYFNERAKENRVDQVATVSLIIGEGLPKVNDVGIAIGGTFINYNIEEVKDTLVDNIYVEGVNPTVRIRYYYENGSFLELKGIDRFLNQGLSGTNQFRLFQDSISYQYNP